MSRYCGEKDTKAILEAAEHWRQRGLLSDGYIFSDKALWCLENLKALDQYFINQLDEGEGNFFEKLSAQLAPTSPEVKQLAAEMLWVMLLCPSNIGINSKKAGIQKIWGWSGVPFPEDSPWLSDATLLGVGSAGMGYNNLRWRELIFLIRLTMALKQLTDGERRTLLGDAMSLAKWLEKVPECNSRQFRHMMLFMLFPDNFERIFGGTDRRKIVSAFSGKSDAQINALTAFEIDKELSSIRKQQEQTFKTSELDFYVPPLRDLWRDDRNVSWLITWNPKFWPWASLEEDRDSTHTGKTVNMRWSFANRNARVGDKAYLIRTGVAPKGIVAVGNIVKAPFEAPHWDEEKAADGKTRWCVEIDFTRIQNPLVDDPYIAFEELEKIDIDQQKWNPQSSGIEIKPQSAGAIEKLWEKVVGTPSQPEKKVVSPGAANAINLIYYGPPGTGKTYQLRELLKEKYSSTKQIISRESWLSQQLVDIRWFDAIFAALYELGAQAKVVDIAMHEFIALKARAMGRHQNITQTIWATLQAHTIDASKTVQYKHKSPPLVFDKSTASVWHMVGDWQEECAEQVSLAEALKSGPKSETDHHRYEFVTFHQAYSYEDFIEGLRPVTNGEDGQIAYLVVPGVFHRIAQKAKSDPKQRYAIFIDEINRGNIAKIFGELITLIEPDKRAEYNERGEKVSGMELTLPYSRTLFGVPKNLDIYGAMNTADRSIALLDTALRRRFKFQELMPNPGLISGSRVDGLIEDGEGGTINLRALLEAMNRRIRFFLNRDMTLGHAYFMNIKDFPSLKDVMLNQIIPLLQEYFYENWNRIQLVFQDVGPGGEKSDSQIICHSTLNEQDVLGGDHGDYDDLIEYWVAPPEDITPDSIRKIYEKVS